MKGAPPGGFTIVEVMMVLAVSATLLISAVSIFNGKREDTFFTQAVYDLRSELQSLANNVSSQSVPGLQDYKCTATYTSGVMRPVLSVGNSTGQDCVYLGQVIQVATDSTTLYSYPVFGLRTVYNGALDTGIAPTSIDQTHPEPATNATNPNITVAYGLLNGLKIIKAQVGITDKTILTLYSPISDTNTSGNEIDVLAQTYSGASTDPATQVKECIEGSGCQGPTMVTNSPWKLCVQYVSKQAQISLKSTPTGIVTQLNLNGCP